MFRRLASEWYKSGCVWNSPNWVDKEQKEHQYERPVTKVEDFLDGRTAVARDRGQVGVAFIDKHVDTSSLYVADRARIKVTFFFDTCATSPSIIQSIKSHTFNLHFSSMITGSNSYERE